MSPFNANSEESLILILGSRLRCCSFFNVDSTAGFLLSIKGESVESDQTESHVSASGDSKSSEGRIEGSHFEEGNGVVAEGEEGKIDFNLGFCVAEGVEGFELNLSEDVVGVDGIDGGGLQDTTEGDCCQGESQYDDA